VPNSASSWQEPYPVRAYVLSDNLARPIAKLNFQNDSVLDRISAISNLSFLTLVETRQSRLFLGINADGFVGLHFGAFSHHRDEQYLELARMPYLKKLAADSQSEQPRPE